MSSYLLVERTWVTPEVRAAARDMRLRNAAEGVREPVQVREGNYVISAGKE